MAPADYRDAWAFCGACLMLAVSLYLHYSGFWVKGKEQGGPHSQDNRLSSAAAAAAAAAASTPQARRRRSRRQSVTGVSSPGLPVHSGVAFQSNIHLDCLSLCRYMPENTYVLTPKTAKREETDDSAQSPLSPGYLGLPESQLGGAADNEARLSHAESSMPSGSARESKSHKSSRATLSRASLRQSLTWAQQAHQNKTKADALSLSKLPFLPGCEADGPAAREMLALFPGTPLTDIVRFLVARKGDVKAAADMMTKALEWHSAHFPLPPELRSQVESAFSAGCFFTHGQARDGTPVLYMRGALYDGSKASPEAYVLAAAHAITHALAQSAELNVTVVVHAVNVPGAPNDNADLAFIKGFISVLSDNFPERLKRLAIFPFPWYGRAIWSILKVFVDKRTQNKVMLLSGDGTSIPAELSEFLDPDQIPVVCGGRNRDKVLDMRTTL